MTRMYVDRSGNNYTQEQAESVVIRATGSTAGVLDDLKVGQVYQNGSVWFQRMYDE